MGCDIHLHTEVKVNGKWEHYSHPNFPRSYRLFALMANVRNGWPEIIKPISEPKGIPDDASILTQLSFERWGGDAHSASWLSASEIECFQEKAKAFLQPGCISIEHDSLGYLEGNSWGYFRKFRSDYPEWLEDVRWVFWFDN